MLKSKRSVSACSLISCRIRAESLARAFNNRIWPCVWISQRTSAERDDGMSNGIDDEEEFFDASPSPVELGDESVFCQQHSSAATEAGRAKLYELLQQHATDDAIDVFYDAGEDAGLADTCLSNDEDGKDVADQVCGSSQCCKHLDDESYFSNTSDSNGRDDEPLFLSNCQNADHPAASETAVSQESELIGEKYQQIISDASACCGLNAESICDEKSSSQEKINNESVSTIENVLLNETENDILNKENFLALVDDVLKEDSLENVDKVSNGSAPICIDEILKENSVTFAGIVSNKIQEYHTSRENTENSGLPSSDIKFVATQEDDKSFTGVKNQLVLKSAPETAAAEDADKNEAVSRISIEVESPSTSSDSSEAKTPSPTSRFQQFEESRPKILRSTSLKTGKTPPGTPSRKKIVRFADVLGLDLEDVHHIMTGDLPTIPSSAYTDLNLKGVDLSPCETISETLEINRRDSSSWQSVRGATATNVVYPQFAIPGEQPDFMDRVRHQGICLETVLVSEMNVQCTCRVMNYGYHKRVVARYTVNDWLSSNDIDATYVSGSSNNETDSFSFSIFLSLLNKDVKFALKYMVNGQVYWDNNRNQNYCLTYHGNDQMHHLPSPLWQHQFW